MCKCNPAIRSPWCGKPGCQKPDFEPNNGKRIYINRTHYLLQFFDEDRHKRFMEDFYNFANNIYDDLPQNAETTTALRKLMECRDAVLRSMKYKEQ